MMTQNQPLITSQTTAQNEAVETVLSRLKEAEIIVPHYQRDSDEWDDVKKSLFIESILNRLTVPAFYLAPSEEHPQISEVVDGQQRLTTLSEFFNGAFTLLKSEQCPYFGESIQYAGCNYGQLEETWKQAFRRYNLTLVSLPNEMPLDLRLEIFRRINEGGTPLSGQDIRLSYYSASPAVRYVQLTGVYDSKRSGAKRMIDNCKADFDWPWTIDSTAAERWNKWWDGTKTSTGQTASEMFLWFLIGRCKDEVDKILDNKTHLTKLRLNFRNRTEEVLDIVCAQLKYEDQNGSGPRLFPSSEELQSKFFPPFLKWWLAMRDNCSSQVTVAKHRSIALFIPGLMNSFGDTTLSDNQWGWIGRFVAGTRKTAQLLGVDFPESKGRWQGNRGQRAQLEAYCEVARLIASK